MKSIGKTQGNIDWILGSAGHAEPAHISLFDLLNRLIWMFKFRLGATQFARGFRDWLIPFLRPASHFASLFRVPLASQAPPASSSPAFPNTKVTLEAGLLTSRAFRALHARTHTSISSPRPSHSFSLNWRILFALRYAWSFTHGDFPIARPARRNKKKVGMQMEIRIAFVA